MLRWQQLLSLTYAPIHSSNHLSKGSVSCVNLFAKILECICQHLCRCSLFLRMNCSSRLSHTKRLWASWMRSENGLGRHCSLDNGLIRCSSACRWRKTWEAFPKGPSLVFQRLKGEKERNTFSHARFCLIQSYNKCS